MAYRWETMETVTDFIFLGSKIIADGDCSLEFKRCLLLGRKAMTNLDSTLKSRDITWTTKVCLVKAMIFCISHIWMWEMDHKEGWAPKNWCFWTVVLEKTLENPLDCKEIQPIHPKGNKSWIFTGRTDDEVKLQYFSHLMRRADSLEKTLMLGKIEGRRRRGWQRIRWLMASPTWWMWVWASFGSWWQTGKSGMLQSMGSQGVGHDQVTELNWTMNDQTLGGKEVLAFLWKESHSLVRSDLPGACWLHTGVCEL